MRVLVVHNRYQQPGGEDQVFEAEIRLLRDAGHEVRTYTEHNDRIRSMAPAHTAAATIWSRRHRAAVSRSLHSWRPDVVHAHNTFPLLSPAVAHAAHAAGIPFVQTLHNYRLVCPGALLFRDGRTCEECVSTPTRFPAVRHACYRGSRAATAVTAAMLATHDLLGTWSRCVTTYVALTEFARSIFVRGGLPAERIRVKPNFLGRDPGVGDGASGDVLFVGRLSPEKGVGVLLEAAELMGGSLRFTIVGDGPLGADVREAARRMPWVRWLGRCTHEETLQHMRSAACLAFPSTWYEGLPMTIVEAFACGLPVVASDLGAMQALVTSGENGVRFRPGDASELAGALARATSDAGRRNRWGAGARRTFEDRFLPGRNLQILESIYSDAVGRVRPGGARTVAA
jgi:glycosyltransferase involved in cell wall biosynthesis